MQSENDSKRTKRTTQQFNGIFDEYLREKKKECPKNNIELATILKSFYAEVRKQTGELYSKSSLCALRFGLNRQFKKHLDVDIVKGNEFKEANQVFIANCLKLKRGLAKTHYKPAIDDEDVKTLYESGAFDTNKPATLQNKAIFDIMLFFCVN